MYAYVAQQLRHQRSKDDPLSLASRDHVPSRKQVILALKKIIPILLDETDEKSLEEDLDDLSDLLGSFLPEKKVDMLINTFPKARSCLALALETAFFSDPAAKSYAEILVSYPSVFVMAVYRIAHTLYLMNEAVVARLMSEYAHSKTGIDIHPGAKIGCAFFVDHGTGTVIGETAVIGNRCKLYHGITLGAFSNHKGRDDSGKKRHPTLEDDVTIYPNATILGGDTVIKRGCIIGGNVWLTSSVEPFTIVRNGSPSLEFRTRRPEWWETSTFSRSELLTEMKRRDDLGVKNSPDEVGLSISNSSEDLMNEIDAWTTWRNRCPPMVGPITGIDYSKRSESFEESSSIDSSETSQSEPESQQQSSTEDHSDSVVSPAISSASTPLDSSSPSSSSLPNSTMVIGRRLSDVGVSDWSTTESCSDQPAGASMKIKVPIRRRVTTSRNDLAIQFPQLSSEESERKSFYVAPPADPSCSVCTTLSSDVVVSKNKDGLCDSDGTDSPVPSADSNPFTPSGRISSSSSTPGGGDGGSSSVHHLLAHDPYEIPAHGGSVSSSPAAPTHRSVLSPWADEPVPSSAGAENAGAHHHNNNRGLHHHPTIGVDVVPGPDGTIPGVVGVGDRPRTRNPGDGVRKVALEPVLWDCSGVNSTTAAVKDTEQKSGSAAKPKPPVVWDCSM